MSCERYFPCICRELAVGGSVAVTVVVSVALALGVIGFDATIRTWQDIK